jgi:hypothetical protein
MGISAYVLILADLVTFVYFTRLQMVAALGDDLDMRTGVFAQIDLITQVATLVLQVIVAGHLMKRLGVAVTLAHYAHRRRPRLHRTGDRRVAGVPGLLRRDVPRGAARDHAAGPGDAVHRGQPRGQVQGEGVHRHVRLPRRRRGRRADGGLLGRFGMGLAGLATVAVPLAIVWAGLGIWLGRVHAQTASELRSFGTARGVRCHAPNYPGVVKRRLRGAGTRERTPAVRAQYPADRARRRDRLSRSAVPLPRRCLRVGGSLGPGRVRVGGSLAAGPLRRARSGGDFVALDTPRYDGGKVLHRGGGHRRTLAAGAGVACD